MLKFKTFVLLSICCVGLPSLVIAASLEKAILLNEHGLTTDAKRELIDLIFEKGIKAADKAQAYYLLGNIAFGEDRIKAALNSWQYLVDKYPKSEEAGLVRDRIAELSEIVIGTAKENLDNAVARSYLRHADFYSDDKSEIFKLDASGISNVEAAIKWYDKVITEFAKTEASRIAYEGKLKTLLGWKEPGSGGASYGIMANFSKYLPILIQTFEEFEKDHPDASTLQAFRYQIAQAYWVNSLQTKSLAETYRELATSSRRFATLGEEKEAEAADKKVQRLLEDSPKYLKAAEEWLKRIIDITGDHDSFYRDLAERRLKNLDPR